MPSNMISAQLVPVPELSDQLETAVEEAREVFSEQARAIQALAARIDFRFVQATDMLLNTVNKVVVVGMGKSGHIGRKMAATFASTGTPSFFVQAAEAYHGDLGMIAKGDVVVLISQSGETEEIVRLLPHLLRLGVSMIALTGCLSSTLALGVNIALDVGVKREACPNNLAPTNSTLATLAMGDALAVSLMNRRNFKANEFAKFHPGGVLGRQLLTVKEAMRSDDLPYVSAEDTVGSSLIAISRGRLGLTLVMKDGRLIGLVTDGDLRRAMQKYPDLLGMRVSEIMTNNPVTIPETTLLVDAHRRMQQMKLKAFVVVDVSGNVTGVVEVFEE